VSKICVIPKSHSNHITFTIIALMLHVWQFLFMGHKLNLHTSFTTNHPPPPKSAQY